MSEPGRDGKPMPVRLGVQEFQANVTAILRQVRNGSAFLITSCDEVVAEIHPPSHAVRHRRQPGALRGKIRMANDFDALPQDVVAAMESGER